MIYKLCKINIRAGRTNGIRGKLGAFLLHDQITQEQYNELMAMLPEQEPTEA